MSETQEQNAGFYEQKGMVRHMIILPEAHKVKLKRIAKTYAITQGEVVEVMLDQINLDQMGSHFEAKRALKDDGRLSKSVLVNKMKTLSPEQMRAIEAIMAGTAV